MLAGDSFKRNFTGDFPAEAINFACLGAGQPETNSLPNYNCPSGLRAQVYFPSCWVGNLPIYKRKNVADHVQGRREHGQP
jgi:hypothetical protein